MIAGFETPDDGSIEIDGKDVVNSEAQPAQYRHGVSGLCALSQYDRCTERFVRPARFGQVPLGNRCHREGNAEPHPARPSGRPLPLPDVRWPAAARGASARALRHQPQVLLLDEPLSALDAKIRISLREEIRAIQQKLGITTVFVTHDQEEALSISDRIVVMHEGRADQIGSPFDIYNRPARASSHPSSARSTCWKLLSANRHRTASISTGARSPCRKRSLITPRASH